MRVLSLDKYQIFFRRSAISFLQLLAMRDEATEKIHWIQSDSFHYNHLCLDFLSVLAAFAVFGVHFGVYTAKAKEAQQHQLRRYFNSRIISFWKSWTPFNFFCLPFICSSYIRKNIVSILKKKEINFSDFHRSSNAMFACTSVTTSSFRRMCAAGGYEVIPKHDFCGSRHPLRLFDKHVAFQPRRFHQKSPAEWQQFHFWRMWGVLQWTLPGAALM